MYWETWNLEFGHPTAAPSITLSKEFEFEPLWEQQERDQKVEWTPFSKNEKKSTMK